MWFKTSECDVGGRTGFLIAFRFVPWQRDKPRKLELYAIAVESTAVTGTILTEPDCKAVPIKHPISSLLQTKLENRFWSVSLNVIRKPQKVRLKLVPQMLSPLPLAAGLFSPYGRSRIRSKPQKPKPPTPEGANALRRLRHRAARRAASEAPSN